MFRKNHPQTINGFVRDTTHRPRLATRPILIFLGIFIFGVLAIPILQENGVGSWLRLMEEEKELSAKVEALEKANVDLVQAIDAIENDPATLEKLAREELNMHLPGEKVVLVIDEKPIQE